MADGGRDAAGGWAPSLRYPDPLVRSLDPRFDKYRLPLASVERLYTGLRAGARGRSGSAMRAVSSGAISPTTACMRWDEETGRRQRLPQALEQRQRQYPRPPGPPGHLRASDAPRHPHRIRRHASPCCCDRFDGKRLNSPNDVVVKSDGSIWFTDPRFGILSNYEGEIAEQELPMQRLSHRRQDRRRRRSSPTASMRPNGLAFSPDEKKLYVVESRAASRARFYAFDVGGDRAASSPTASC